MKKLFTILSILIAANSLAAGQRLLLGTATNNEIDILQPIGQATFIDSTFIKKSLAIQPVIVNMAGDTAAYMTWKAFDIDRSDTTAGMNTYVSLLDRTGKTVATFNCPIPARIVNQWSFDPKPIDDFILSQNKRLKKL